jgi:hypothetical protein
MFLNRYALILHLNCLDSEVNTDGGNIILFKLVIAILQQNVSFADARITNNDQFDGATILFLLFFGAFISMDYISNSLSENIRFVIVGLSEFVTCLHYLNY